jgi:LPS export ABC transporter protein LptC
MVSFFIFFIGCAKEEGKEQKGVVEATQVVEGFQLTETEFGRKAWILTAHKALEYEEKIEVFGVQIEFFDPDGKRNSVLTSDQGKVLHSSRDMVATGNVIVQAEDGTKLETDQLQWVQERNKIVTDSNVRITKGTSIITGKGMESNPDLSHIEIREDFKATKKDE